MFLEIPGALEEQLARKAKRCGLSTEQYALGLLGAQFERQVRPRNGVEVVAFWRREGVIGAWSDIEDSADYASKMRVKAERRARPSPEVDSQGDESR